MGSVSNFWAQNRFFRSKYKFKFFRWVHIQFCDKYLVRQAPFHEPQHLKNSVIVSGNNSIWSEKEWEEIIDCVLEIYLRKRRITMLSFEADSAEQPPDSDDSHKIDDEHNEDDLDSEDERLADELMVFNVGNDTSDVSDADE